MYLFWDGDGRNTRAEAGVEHTGAHGSKDTETDERDESRADDLNRERGIVSSRVASVAAIC